MPTCPPSENRASARKRDRGTRRVHLMPWLLAVLTLALSGCGAVRRDLPDHASVARSSPLPIDGVWRDETSQVRYRIEQGRIWMLDALVVGPLRIDPGQVVVTDVRQSTAQTFEGNDIGAAGRWTAESSAAGLSVVVYAAVGPFRSRLVPLELDDRAWFDAQIASSQIVASPGAGGSAFAAAGAGNTVRAATSDATTLVVRDRKAFGQYHALVIGNNGYRNLPRLETAVGDAETVAALLRDQYGFRVTLLRDASRAQVLTALRHLRESLTDGDNLLIYYAGHGWLDKDADQGYWLPIDAERDSDVYWISNSTITGYLRSIPAKHIMIVADSCYSGTLTRGIKLDVRPPDYLERISRLKARVVLSSGGLEPVADGGGGQHSAFARYFIDELQANDGVIDSTTLYSRIRQPIMLAADQAPELADIRKAGHEGGDFLFIREKPAADPPR